LTITLFDKSGLSAIMELGGLLSAEFKLFVPLMTVLLSYYISQMQLQK